MMISIIMANRRRKRARKCCDARLSQNGIRLFGLFTGYQTGGILKNKLYIKLRSVLFKFSAREWLLWTKTSNEDSTSENGK